MSKVFAKSIVYRELSSIHMKRFSESGIRTLNKDSLYELYNFINYTIGNILKTLQANVKPKAFLPPFGPSIHQQQLKIDFGEV